MDEQFAMLFRDMFQKALHAGTDEYFLLIAPVARKRLFSLYEKTEVVEIIPIEMISLEEKKKYWNIAKRFTQVESEAIKISKAAYMLTIIGELKKEEC
jgi:hypothetical protein